jgi:hypothetical protein
MGNWLTILLYNALLRSGPKNTEPNFFSLARVSDGMQSTISYVCNLLSLTAALQKCNLDAQPIVCASHDDPAKTYTTNVMHLLEAVRQTPGVKAIVVNRLSLVFDC